MESKFLNLTYKAEQHVLYCVWFPETLTAKWEQIQVEMFRYAEVVLKHKPKSILIDERKMFYPWAIENQTWVTENITPKTMEVQIKRIAVVMSEDIIVQLSTDQLFEEINPRGTSIKYFDNYDEAEVWVQK